MKRALLLTAVAIGLGLAAQPISAQVKQFGSNPTSEELIQGLTPKPGAAPIKFRGLHLLTTTPATESGAPMPAVALDVKFKLNSAELSEEAKETIKRLGGAINSDQLSKYHFLVEGHTDSTGRPEHNLVLSKQRAQSVRNYLVQELGVSPSRLEAVGRGQDLPIDPQDPKNPANRRVQVVNIGQ